MEVRKPGGVNLWPMFSFDLGFVFVILILCSFGLQVAGLQATLRNLETGMTVDSLNMTREERRLMYASGRGPTQSSVKAAREGSTRQREIDPTNLDVTNQSLPRHPNVRT